MKFIRNNLSQKQFKQQDREENQKVGEIKFQSFE